MKKTGNMLREARESKGVSLQEVSIHLKINTRILRSLEDGDLDKLPAKTFLRGFVQSYSSYLRIDPTQIMDIFQLEMGSTHPGMITTDLTVPPNATEILPQNPTQNHSNTNKSDPNKITSPKNPANTQRRQSDTVEPQAPALSVDSQVWSRYVQVGIVICALVILGLIVTVKRTIDKYEKEATLASLPGNLETVKPGATETHEATSTTHDTPTTLENLNKTEETPSATATVVPAQAPTPATSTPSLSSTAAPSTPASQNIESSVANSQTPQTSPTSAIASKTLDKTGTPTKTVTPTVTPQASVTPQPSVSASSQPSPQTTSAHLASAPNSITPPTPAKVGANPTTPSSALPEAKQQIVIIEALDKVTIEYTIDNGQRGTINLKPEGFHTFKAKDRIALVVSDGGSVNLIHNGKDKGPPGNLGQPIKLNFP